ncbi:MAG TPA: alkaline phosphatase family protein, partial [bacterium]|nr:alkaline phosphatase family protein [bacterium]
MFARAYVPERSGDIFLVPEEGEFLLSAEGDSAFYHFMHGGPYSYDVRIPLLFQGAPFIQKGVYSQSASLQDVAPTLLTLLDTRIPKDMTGHVLEDALAGSSQAPGVIVLLVLDGFGANTWSRYESQLPNLSRLKSEGAWFANAELNYLPSVTSAGHATASTGTDPRTHGIQGNASFDRQARRKVEPFEGMDPKDYFVPTLADIWNVKTEGRTVIIAQGGHPRATIALAGHGACEIPGARARGAKIIVATFDRKTTGWTTNPSCYRLPEYLAERRADAHWENTSWLGHSFHNGETFLRTGFFPRFQMDALLEMIEREKVGRDSIPDLLLINLKTSDYVAHQYGPDSKEMEAAVQAIDEEMGRLTAVLEDKTRAGRHGAVIVITADHGMPAQCAAPCEGAHYTPGIANAINEHFGSDSLAAYIDESGLQIYLDETKLPKGKKVADVAKFVETLPYIRFALTREEI